MNCSACSAPTTTVLCHRCTDRLVTALHRVPELAGELETTITRQVAQRPVPGGRASESTVPFHAGASTAKYDLLTVLARVVRALHATGPEAVSLPDGVTYTLDSLAGWLTTRPRPTWIADHPYAAHIAAELHLVINRAWSTVDVPPQRRYCGQCDCGTDLYVYGERQWARCADCDTEWPVDEMRTWMASGAEDHLLDAQGISDLMPALTGTTITPATVRGWARHGRIAPQGSKSKGKRAIPLYRVGDAVDVIASRTLAA